MNFNKKHTRLAQMRDNEEKQRYVEYFQRQLVREGSEDYLNGLTHWFESNRLSIAEKFLALNPKDGSVPKKWADAAIAHKNSGDYDFFHSHQIFEPLLAKVLEICSKVDCSPRLPIRFANSPSVEPSPAALPSTDEHILFAGPGTFAFCNYWAKVFSTAFYEIGTLPKKKRMSEAAIIGKLREGRVLVDATQLTLHYMTSGSLLGFGKLEQPENLHVGRTLLVNSMEIFIIAHEVAHFVSHEMYPDTEGIPPGSTLKQLELECDAVGLAVCTDYGVQENNPFAFQLIGPLLFFFALHMSDRTRSIFGGIPQADSESHPSSEERIKFALNFLHTVGANKAVKRSATDALDIATIIGSLVEAVVHDLAESFETSSVA